MKQKTSKQSAKRKRFGKKGQIFLVCTIVITIYMLSFINIVYELNINQYSEPASLDAFESAYNNFQTETEGFMIGLLANYSQPATIIDSNITASQLVDTWLSFAEEQMLKQGYIAVFEISWLIPTILPLELVTGNGFLSLQCNIDVFLECNLLTIDSQMTFDYYFGADYTNTATNGLISVYYDSLSTRNYIGYADVTVNGSPVPSLFNGTYINSSPLAGADVIQCTTPEQIIITRVV